MNCALRMNCRKRRELRCAHELSCGHETTFGHFILPRLQWVELYRAFKGRLKENIGDVRTDNNAKRGCLKPRRDYRRSNNLFLCFITEKNKKIQFINTSSFRVQGFLHLYRAQRRDREGGRTRPRDIIMVPGEENPCVPTLYYQFLQICNYLLHKKAVYPPEL